MGEGCQDNISTELAIYFHICSDLNLISVISLGIVIYQFISMKFRSKERIDDLNDYVGKLACTQCLWNMYGYVFFSSASTQTCYFSKTGELLCVILGFMYNSLLLCSATFHAFILFGALGDVFQIDICSLNILKKECCCIQINTIIGFGLPFAISLIPLFTNTYGFSGSAIKGYQNDEFLCWVTQKWGYWVLYGPITGSLIIGIFGLIVIAYKIAKKDLAYIHFKFIIFYLVIFIVIWTFPTFTRLWILATDTLPPAAFGILFRLTTSSSGIFVSIVWYYYNRQINGKQNRISHGNISKNRKYDSSQHKVDLSDIKENYNLLDGEQS